MGSHRLHFGPQTKTHLQEGDEATLRALITDLKLAKADKEHGLSLQEWRQIFLLQDACYLETLRLQARCRDGGQLHLPRRLKRMPEKLREMLGRELLAGVTAKAA